MKHPITPTLFLLLIFVLAQVIGLVIANNYLERTTEGVKWGSLPSVLGAEIERPQLNPQQTVWMVVGSIIAGTLIFLGILRFNFFRLIKIWFFLALFFCLHIAFGAFVPSVVALVLALIFTYLKLFRNNFYIHNFTELFIYGGLSAIFIPLLTIKSAFVLLVLISLYDAYAVWKSKHMITLAKAQASHGLFAGLIVPYKFPRFSVKDLFHKPQTSNERLQTSKDKSQTPTAILGGGDISFPLLFSGAVLVKYGFFSALVIIPFSAVALAGLFYYGEKKKFYPAMPFISAGCFVGFLVLWLFLL
ncbi:hypothetical protein HZA97_07385 [Candidatus Woesearchaeota archaeon]|nr:hypothetical protein [Candidatus Woesearchaeota archaeon]